MYIIQHFQLRLVLLIFSERVFYLFTIIYLLVRFLPHPIPAHRVIEDMDRFVNLGSPAGLLPETQIARRLGNVPNLAFQYFQLSNLFRRLQ